jgi:uncharacterized protein YbjT (DUF2867 family)
MWKADLNNEKDIVRALKGAYGVFAVTNFWETTDPNVETKQGKNVADAAKVCLTTRLLTRAALMRAGSRSAASSLEFSDRCS